MQAFGVWIFLGLALGLAGAVSGCRREPVAVGPSPRVIEAMNRGVSLMGQYQYDGAVKAFEEALAADPGLTEARINLAIARFNRAQKEQRDLEAGGELLDSVLKQEPTNTRALYFKGIVAQHVGQTEAAVSLFNQVVQQRPDDGVAWYLLGLCKQRLGQGAETELQRAIELRPYLGSAYYRLWQVYQAADQPEKAAPYLDQFKQLRENPLVETIELPQYNQMGDLALVLPLPARRLSPITRSTFAADPRRALFRTPDSLACGVRGTLSTTAPLPFGGLAAGDLDGDGQLDLALTRHDADGRGRLLVLRGDGAGGFADVTATMGLDAVSEPLSCALGDYDNDGRPDLLVGGAGGAQLLRGSEDGRLRDVTDASGLGATRVPARGVLFLDADHDGDLDLFVAGSAGTGNQLWNNNADGSFTNLAPAAGLVLEDATTVGVLPGDLDGDRDQDLVLLREGQPVKLLLNELSGRYRTVEAASSVRADRGGVLQDVNGDSHLDLVALGGSPPQLQLCLGDGRAQLRPDPTFDSCARSAASWGELRGVRAADLDLDGDLDLVVFAQAGHVLFNDGGGRFVLQPNVWSPPATAELVGAELIDLSGDLVADLVQLERGPTSQVTLRRSELTPPSTAAAIVPTGMRSRDKRTRSPASGYGTILVARAGLSEQKLVYAGLAGGTFQSQLPAVLGLRGAGQADYVQLRWPDGVTQVEVGLRSGQVQTVAELERKISSCPVLFAWNGTRFECVTDCAGVGGLGYFVAPGEYATPRSLEHLKIEPHQLRARDGVYELRITEPMEECAYVDRLELLVVDHPHGWQVYPDERLAVAGPAPTHELLAVEQPIRPRRAIGPGGQDCTDRLAEVDRFYAYSPALDRRFFGFCQPHTLELDFGDQFAGTRPDQRVFLFLHGYLEYPYSQTVYAAGQARVGWQPIRIDRRQPDGQWKNIVPDAGAFGGMARMITIDLTGLVRGPDCRLRLTSNLEIYYDQAFLATVRPLDGVHSRSIPLTRATLRHAGFAREYSPDGRQPLLYDYERSDATAPFHVLKGAYTRYGPVEELLSDFDDRYAILGPGDEIALSFDAATAGDPPPGTTRSFILVCQAWCKDMDLYTGTPQTLTPLPYAAMSRYPYPDTERYPETEAHRRYHATYNTRQVE
jgi:tetratricopeptide (TPR) repeat protein